MNPPFFAPLRQSWSLPAFRRKAYWTLALLVPVLALLPRFLGHIEERPGVVLADPLLAVTPSVDLTWLIFGCIYIALVLALIALLEHPDWLLLAARTYAIMALFRMAGMWLLALDPPTGMIALRDPFVEFFGSGGTLTRDLFFSGHTSTLVMFALVMPGKGWRRAFLVLSVIVGLGVLLQHVHYAIDVFAAPFFAYGAYAIARGWLKRW